MSIKVMRIFKESFKDVWGHRLEWAKVAFAPFIVFLVGFIIMALSYWSVGQPLWSLDALTGQAQEQLSGDNAFLTILGNSVYQIAQVIAIMGLYINGFRYAVLN